MPTFPDWQHFISMLEEGEGDELNTDKLVGLDYVNQKLLQRPKRKSVLDPYFAAHREFEKLYETPSPSLSSDSNYLEPHKDPIPPSIRCGMKSRDNTASAPTHKALDNSESSSIDPRTRPYHNTTT